ncbi:MAG: Response regulator receiver protein, partial [uncultured bacterium]
EKIRNIDTNCLFIIISTLDSPEYILQALRLKANDYLVKPALGKKLTDLLEKYAEIITGRTKTREVLGMIYSMTLGMKIGNDLGLVSKIVDRLMLETEQVIAPTDRIGVHLGLFEMLTNSIEHGSLEISYEEKSEAMESDILPWKSFLQQRYQNPLYASREVCLEYQLGQNRCEWLITDQGPGFDWQSIPDPANPENLLSSHGRGVMLSALQFDEIAYIGKGNQVRLVKRFS